MGKTTEDIKLSLNVSFKGVSNKTFWNQNFHFKIRKNTTFYPQNKIWHFHVISDVSAPNSEKKKSERKPYLL